MHETKIVNSTLQLKEKKKKNDWKIGGDIQFKIEKINKDYEKIKEDSTNAKIDFIDRIKQQILKTKK